MGGILSPTSRERGLSHQLPTPSFGFDGIDERNEALSCAAINGVDYISKLPPDILRLKLCEFLFPHEQFKFARINKFFASLYGINHYNFKYFADRDRQCWFRYIHAYYVESGGWLLFKKKKFDSLSSDTRLCLVYFIVYYDSIIKHQIDEPDESHKDAIKLRKIIPRNVNHLRVIESDNVETALTQFIRNILYRSSSHNPINAIYIERCNLNDSDVCQLSYSLIQRKSTSNLRGFSIGGNPLITDQYIGLFFDVISKQCPALRTLGLHSTNISNKSCRIILDFYASQKEKQKHEQHEQLLNEEIGERVERKMDDDGVSIQGEEHRYGADTVLEKLYLMRNSKITEKGIDILNEIFVNKYLDDTRLEHQVVINCARCGLKTRKETWNRTIRV